MKFQDCYLTALDSSISIFLVFLETTITYINTTFTRTSISINETKVTAFVVPSANKTGKPDTSMK